MSEKNENKSTREQVEEDLNRYFVSPIAHLIGGLADKVEDAVKAVGGEIDQIVKEAKETKEQPKSREQREGEMLKAYIENGFSREEAFEMVKSRL